MKKISIIGIIILIFGLVGCDGLFAPKITAEMDIVKCTINAGLEGSGTSSDPYLISNAVDFHKISDCNDGYYKLTADIDLDESPFERGNSEYYYGFNMTKGVFYGTLDGDGHTISISHNDALGEPLFLQLQNATIQNINFDLNINSSYDYKPIYQDYVCNDENGCLHPVYNSDVEYLDKMTYGISKAYNWGIIASNSIDSTIKNISVNGNITIELDNEFLSHKGDESFLPKSFGALVGSNSGTMENIYMNARITFNVANSYGIFSDNKYMYGYTGGIAGSNTGTISDSIVSGVVKVSTFMSDMRSYAGGITGINSGSIENVLFDGEVYNYCGSTSLTNNSGTGYTGGITGNNSVDGEIRKALVYGFCHIKTGRNSNMAGITAINDGAIEDAIIYWTRDNYMHWTSVSGQQFYGGIIGEGTKFGIENTWYIITQEDIDSISEIRIWGDVADNDEYYVSYEDFMLLDEEGTLESNLFIYSDTSLPQLILDENYWAGNLLLIGDDSENVSEE